MSTFVSVGNATQPFTRMLQAVCEVSEWLPQPVFVQFGSAGSFACPGCRGAAFLTMNEFELRIREARLLILHGGAGSVVQAIRAGRKPIVVPRRSTLGEHVDEHQVLFARELERMGKVFVAHDAPSLARAAEAAMHDGGAGLAADTARLVGMVRDALWRSR